MYLRKRTPFGFGLQSVQARNGSVTIRPNLFMWVFLACFVYGFLGGPAENWIRGVVEPPELYEVVLLIVIPGLAMLPLWYVQGRSVTIDENGVVWRPLFRKRYLTWREIHDYGLSYAYWGQVRLYFSTERLETNGKGKKRMHGKPATILIQIQNRKRSGEILNVCRDYTRIRPFLCSDEGRLEGVLRDR